VSKADRALIGAILVFASAIGLVAVVEAQPPIRIGASASKTGTYAALSTNQLRGYQLCIKHTNDKGGVLGRKLELVVEDDQSVPATAVGIYERLIIQDHVDLLLGPFGTPIVAAVVPVNEKHRMPMVAASGATTSIYEGRKFSFMVYSPSHTYLEGFVELVTRQGLKTLALIGEDSGFPRAAVKGAAELAKKRGLQVVFAEHYPQGISDFSAILTRVRATGADAVAAATLPFNDAVAVTRQMKELNLNPKMFGVTVGSASPRFYELLGRAAEFVYGPSQWEPELVTLRAGGLIPVARYYPGAREFAEAHRREFPGADFSYQTATGYAACQVLTEAIRRAGSLDREKVRDAISKLDFNTVFGAFKVDGEGVQVAHKMVLFQWQDGKKVIVWPEELAPGKPRFPTPPWSQRQ
jgi:branched-chain amino acid transport system substrate-binding protein